MTQHDPRANTGGDTTSGVGRQPGRDNLAGTGRENRAAYRPDTALDARERLGDASLGDLGGTGLEDAGRLEAHPSMADVRSDLDDDEARERR